MTSGNPSMRCRVPEIQPVGMRARHTIIKNELDFLEIALEVEQEILNCRKWET